VSLSNEVPSMFIFMLGTSFERDTSSHASQRKSQLKRFVVGPVIH
jgi:hypothetical protein